jgi:hypothetical protein
MAVELWLPRQRLRCRYYSLGKNSIMTTYIKTTEDGRKVEVIGRAICLGGRPEAYELISVESHPNKEAILGAVPNATHVAGRLPLTLEQANAAREALAAESTSPYDDPRAVAEFFRMTEMRRSAVDRIE